MISPPQTKVEQYFLDQYLIFDKDFKYMGNARAISNDSISQI